MPHDHSHHGSAGRHRLVAALMLSYAVIELVAWKLTHNPLVLADALHNLTDFAYPLMGSVVIVVATRSPRHSLSCYLPTLFSMSVYVASLIILILVEIESADDMARLTPASLTTGLVLASGSFLVNFYALRSLIPEHSSVERSTWVHFAFDAGLAVVIVCGTALRLFGHIATAPYWTLRAAVAIFAVIVVQQLYALRSQLHLGGPHPKANAPV